MNDHVELDPKNLTFSQAYGYEPMPSPLALGELSEEARIRLWNLLVDIPAGPFLPTLERVSRIDDRWRSIVQTLHSNFLLRAMDEFPRGLILGDNPFITTYKQGILHSLPFNKIFDLFQMIMRHPLCPIDFTVEVAETFRECRLAYVVDIEQPVTILPAISPQEGETLMEAIQELRGAGLDGATTHLKNAGESLNEGDWPGAIRESVNAVESVARQLDPKASNTLPEALKSLQKNDDRLHPALKIAIEKLYAFASDEEGVRHSLTDNSQSSAGRDEAIFMFGACASASSYLWRKYRGIS